MMHINRVNNRNFDEIRQFEIIPNYYRHMDGSCLIKCGNTHVICSATIDEKVPHFLKNTKSGWITAEYGMLPCSCFERVERESAKGKQSGRTLEIQRLISRSLRSVVDLKKLGEIQIRIDCDVIQADGGTRTASINGAFIALYLICQKLLSKNIIKQNPIHSNVSAISAGIINGEARLDLDFLEDSHAEIDSNFILSSSGQIIEIQSCGEKRPFSESEFETLFNLAKKGCREIVEKQNEILNKIK